MISSNDVLNEKRKLALKDLIQFTSEQVKKKTKQNLESHIQFKLRKMLKLILLSNMKSTDALWERCVK